MHTLGRLLCLVAALCTVNAHLFLGQGIAWITMIQDRTPELGLSEAVADTFSGDHPCERCCAIADEREKQQQEQPIPESRPTAKFAPVVHGQLHLHIQITDLKGLPGLEPLSLSSADPLEIPSPPPRRA